MVFDEFIYKGKTLREWIEALVQSEKALEVEPCEDAISREEMLKYQWYLHGKMSNEENHKLWQFIKSLPSVTPKQKTGHWVKVVTAKSDNSETWHFECSECGEHENSLSFGRSKYCSHCGAKMESAE